jgi:hypothetical protein
MPRLFLSLLVAFAASTALAQGTSETLTLRSATYSNFRQILTRASPDGQADLPAILNLPVTSSGRLPAVIVVHTLAGFRDQNEGWQAQRLREAGFATLQSRRFCV